MNQQEQNGRNLAVASLAVGIIALVVGLFIHNIVGLILGIVGLALSSMAKKSGCDDGIRVAGFVTSLVAVILCAVTIVIWVACIGTIGIGILQSVL